MVGHRPVNNVKLITATPPPWKCLAWWANLWEVTKQLNTSALCINDVFAVKTFPLVHTAYNSTFGKNSVQNLCAEISILLLSVLLKSLLTKYTVESSQCITASHNCNNICRFVCTMIALMQKRINIKVGIEVKMMLQW